MSEFKINILPFTILNNEISISFSLQEKQGYMRVYKKNLPKNFPDHILDSIEKFAWWGTLPQEGDLTIPVNLPDNKRFAKYYFNKIIFDHFYNQGILTNRNFINDTEVYLEDSSFHSSDYKRFRRFSLRIDNNDLLQGTSLLVSYDNDSFIMNRSVEDLGIPDYHLGKIKYHHRITKFEVLSEPEKEDRANIYAVINSDIRNDLKLPVERNYSENKYKKYYDLIHEFYHSYLKGTTIANCIRILESGFYKPGGNRIRRASQDSNLLLFGNNQTHFTPYVGLKEYGPIEPLASDKPVKFIFIFHEDDNAFANKVYSYLKKGYKSFPGLDSFVKIQFDVDTARSLRFKSQNPTDEIKASIEKLQSTPESAFQSGTTYAALYISRIKKDSGDEEIDEVYYRLKELLLHYGITSQVIYKNNIENPSFNYFLPNIAIALLAKLGGVPWRLYRPIKNDLVVGIGADRSFVARDRFTGIAFCFQNDGRFKGFDAFEKENTSLLASAIKDAIHRYIAEYQGFERLVIHYYKNMSEEEEEPIRAILNNLDSSLPYVIVTINETLSKDYVLFDDSYDGKMPQSGTFVKTKWNEYLLCNNTRYSNNTGTRLDGFPFPVKIKFKSSNYEKINEEGVVRDLIDQVYQFSRMYWKSVRQRNMPVTIEYSKLVAKMVAHFQGKDLEAFARNSLWFL